VQKRTGGPHRGGIPFRRGSLFHLFKNPIYRDKTVRAGEAYEGQHEVIVNEKLWKAVQERLEQSPSANDAVGSNSLSLFSRFGLARRSLMPSSMAGRHHDSAEDDCLKQSRHLTGMNKRNLSASRVESHLQVHRPHHKLRRGKFKQRYWPKRAPRSV